MSIICSSLVTSTGRDEIGQKGVDAQRMVELGAGDGKAVWNMCPNRASEIYKVSYRTPRRRCNGTPSRRDTIPKSRRQPDLDMRFNRKYDYKRAKCEDPAIIRSWFTLVENTIAKYGISLADIYNFDETGFIMGVIAAGIVVTSADRHGKAKSVQLGSRE
ncbi:hypothetical protein HOO65_050447 [Ceratocystis lukuohia]|uniref:Uncharacterized protein n=1 Tax=Ceratocystis lukuohia TaxID=2019550 RepID=A0ABR4MGB8_9PEZI